MAAIDVFYLGLVLVAMFGFAAALAYYSHRQLTRLKSGSEAIASGFSSFGFSIADRLSPSLGCDLGNAPQGWRWPILMTPASTRHRRITSR